MIIFHFLAFVLIIGTLYLIHKYADIIPTMIKFILWAIPLVFVTIICAPYYLNTWYRMFKVRKRLKRRQATGKIRYEEFSWN